MQALCEQIKLHTPLPDLPFTLHTDVSSSGLEAELAQDTAQEERPIYYLRQKLTLTEYKYAVIEKEAFTMRWAIDQLKYYHRGRGALLHNKTSASGYFKKQTNKQ